VVHMAIAINFVTINVNAINRDGLVAVGENNQPGWTTHGKTLFGNCQVFGINFNANIMNNTLDNDFIDTPINDSDNYPSAQAQGL